MDTKHCNTCDTTKPLSDFYVSKGRCKGCISLHRKARYDPEKRRMEYIEKGAFYTPEERRERYSPEKRRSQYERTERPKLMAAREALREANGDLGIIRDLVSADRWALHALGWFPEFSDLWEEVMSP